MYFASKMERYRLLKSGFSASVERRTLCIIKMTFIRSSGQKRNCAKYLEEIDSRAEWIRITSKKLKVAAAGEETCTEVPGISLEALEKIPYLIPGWFLSCPIGSVI